MISAQTISTQVSIIQSEAFLIVLKKSPVSSNGAPDNRMRFNYNQILSKGREFSNSIERDKKQGGDQTAQEFPFNFRAPIESLKNNLVEIARKISPNSNILNPDPYFKAPVALGNIIHRNC